jgi:hypothetical protein
LPGVTYLTPVALLKWADLHRGLFHWRWGAYFPPVYFWFLVFSSFLLVLVSVFFLFFWFMHVFSKHFYVGYFEHFLGNIMLLIYHILFSSIYYTWSVAFFGACVGCMHAPLTVPHFAFHSFVSWFFISFLRVLGKIISS